MDKFIDVHTHILPGLDDGPSDPEDSVKMARIAAEDGTGIMVATPHSLNGVYLNGCDEILKKCDELNKRLVSENIPVKIIPGSEIHICPEVFEYLINNNIMTINNHGKYVFIELPDHFLEDTIVAFINKIRGIGIVPVISHPERNTVISDDIKVLDRFILAGAMTQLTGGSILGKFGKKPLKCAKKMASEGMIHLVGSDCHSPEGRRPGLSDAYKKLTSLIPESEAEVIFFKNAVRITGSW